MAKDMLNILWNDLKRSVPGPTIFELYWIMRNWESYREKAWKFFVSRFPNDIGKLVAYDGFAKRRAANTLLAGRPTADELHNVVVYVKELREKAAKRLLARRPTPSQLASVVISVPSLREKAWKRLRSSKPDEDVLLNVIQEVESLREEAAKILLKRKRLKRWTIRSIATNVGKFQIPAAKRLLKKPFLTEHILFVIREVESLRDEAWKCFQKSEPGDVDVAHVLQIEALRERAWEFMNSRSLTKKALWIAARDNEPLREEAWKKFLSLKPTTEELREVMKARHVLSPRAAKLLLANKPANEDIAYMVHNIPTLSKSAKKLLRPWTHEVMQRIRPNNSM